MSDIFTAFVGEQFEHELDKRFNRVVWHGEAAADTQCMEPQCPCGDSPTEGPARPSKLRGILNLPGLTIE